MSKHCPKEWTDANGKMKSRACAPRKTIMGKTENAVGHMPPELTCPPLFCLECGMECKQDHNSFWCDYCERLWPKGVGSDHQDVIDGVWEMEGRERREANKRLTCGCGADGKAVISVTGQQTAEKDNERLCKSI